MTKVVNKSAAVSLFGTVWAAPPIQTPPPAWELKPGEARGFGNPDGMPAYFYLFTQGAAVPNQQPFWQGYIRSSYEIDVIPESASVTAISQVLTQHDLEHFKTLFRDDPRLQGVTLAQLQEHYTTRDFRGNSAVGLPSQPVGRGIVSDCTYARGVVLLDVLFVVTGAYGLATKMNAATIAKVAEIAAPVMTELEEYFHTLGDESATTFEKVMAAKGILHVVWSASLVEAIYKAAVQSLTWWDMVLYGSLGIATLAGAILTDGAALVAMIAAEIATVAFLVTDAVHAHEVCSIEPPVHRPKPGAIYLQSSSGRRLVPSSNTSLLLHLDPGSYQPPDSDQWKLEATGVGMSIRTYYIRHVDTNQYITAPGSTGMQLTLGAKQEQAACQWIAVAANTKNFPLNCYAWVSATGRGRMHLDQGTSVILLTADPINPDAGFAWRDEPTQPSTVNAMKVYWKLELDPNKNGWNVWSGDPNSGFPGVTLEGTVYKPDSSTYWCVVSMARSNDTDNGIAMVRSWTDAEGPHVQAWFNARGSWNLQGSVDAKESIADAWDSGARLTARIVI
jgi:hypothetical protein